MSLKQRQVLFRACSEFLVLVCVSIQATAKCREFINGLGIAIVSTSKGVMTNKEASAEKIGAKFFAMYIN